MPRFSVCVEMIFRHLPFIERLEATAKSGYDAFEFWQWQDKDIGAIAADQCRHRHVRPIGQGNQAGGRHRHRGSDALQPVDGNGAHAGFQPPDGLRRGGRIAGGRNIGQREAARLSNITDTGEHGSNNLSGYFCPTIPLLCKS